MAAALVDTRPAAQAEGRVPSVALTGGTIAATIHKTGRRLPTPGRVDWGRVDVWWGDERYVPADDADRNAGEARAALLDRLPFDPDRVHACRPPTSGHASLADAAAAYGDVRPQRRRPAPSTW